MSGPKSLQDIFDDDEDNIIGDTKPASSVRNEDERLVASFQDILDFYEKHQREPLQGGGIQEHQLYSRLKSIREHPDKKEILKGKDKFGLLNHEVKVIRSFDDILDDDDFGLLEDDYEGLFDFKHIEKPDERAAAEFVARRKPCLDFEKYEPLFKQVQKDLTAGKRKMVNFKEDNLYEGNYYVHNGMLLLLENINIETQEKSLPDGKRIRKDGRTRCIFENGTESNMLYRSLAKVLYENGSVVTKHEDEVVEAFSDSFNHITEADEEAGIIYVLKSKSTKPEIKEIQDLYKVGYSKTTVEERIKNASQDPTYLMADVSVVMTFRCYNMNPQKLELLLHNFFGSSCLNVDVFDAKGGRHTPREWFIAPLSVIEKAVDLVVSGKIVGYRYDGRKGEIVELDNTNKTS